MAKETKVITSFIRNCKDTNEVGEEIERRVKDIQGEGWIIKQTMIDRFITGYDLWLVVEREL